MSLKSTFLTKLTFALVLICASIIANTSFAQPIFFSGTGNHYELIQTSQIWDEAAITAATFSFNGAEGHLATITSQAENDFLLDSLNIVGAAWIGLSQELGAQEPSGGFNWITGEEFIFDNFGQFEPNNNSGNPNNANERFVDLNGTTGFWNDINSDGRTSFIVEYETSQLPEPSALIVNGSFEDGDFVGFDFVRLVPGDTALTGWTIGGVAVDWHNTVSFTSPNSGDKVLDLHLDGAAGTQGTISQSFATVPGELYELSFFLAGPGSNLNFPNPRSVNVDIAGIERTFSTPASLNTDLQWAEHRLRFVATDSTTTLQFSSPHNGSGFWGPLLDDVSVSAVTSVITFGDMDVLGTGTYTSDPTDGATLLVLNSGEITFGLEVNHSFPFSPDVSDFLGTDQIFTSSAQSAFGDGYSASPDRQTGPQTLLLDYSTLVDASVQIETLTLGIAADDFQFSLFSQPFTASINGTPNQSLTDALNGLTQTGPQVQFFTIGIDVGSLTSNNQLLLSIDQAGDGRDGWAIDFLTVGVTTSIVSDPGDLNQDGVVNMSDITPFISVLFTGGFQAEADFNGDGFVNFLDISAFVAILSGQ